MKINHVKTLVVRVSLHCGFCFAQDVLDEVTTQTTTNSSFLTKGKIEDEIIIDFASLSDLFYLNQSKYHEVWEDAIAGTYSDSMSEAREKFMRQSVSDMNNNLFDYIRHSTQLNDQLDLLKTNLNSLSILNGYSNSQYIFKAKNKLMLGNFVKLIGRGESISDHLSEDELANYNYKENIKNIWRTQDCECVLIAMAPKRKRNAKPTLYLKRIGEIITIVPIHSNICLSLCYE
ncbi:hypothetical protein [Photobacterium damselae]|uniref:hypothetical protein n=1 Tax=Photobacterium damselae TaxID=38293 RepID=UPI0040692D52